MPTPTPVGRIHSDQPRAVMVREPENLKDVHSAIHCGINIYTDDRKQAELIMEKWPSLLEEFSKAIEDCLAFNEDHV